MNAPTSTAAERRLRDAVLRAANKPARFRLIERIRRLYGRVRASLFLALGGGAFGFFLMFIGVFGLNGIENRLLEHFPSVFFSGYGIAVLLLGTWSRRVFEKRLGRSQVARVYGGAPMTDAEIFRREWRAHRGRIRAFLFGLLAVLLPATEWYLKHIDGVIQDLSFSRYPFCAVILLTTGVNVFIFTLGGKVQASRTNRVWFSLIGFTGMVSGAISQIALAATIHWLYYLNGCMSEAGVRETMETLSWFASLTGFMWLASFLCACAYPFIERRAIRNFRFTGDLPVTDTPMDFPATSAPGRVFDEGIAESEIRRKFATVRNEFQPRGIFEWLLHKWYTREERDVAEMLRARGEFNPFDHWYVAWPCAVIGVTALTAYIGHISHKTAIQAAQIPLPDARRIGQVESCSLDLWQFLFVPMYFGAAFAITLPISFALLAFLPTTRKVNGIRRISGSLFAHWPHYPASPGCVRKVIVKKIIVFWLSAFGPVAFLLFSLFLFSDQLTLLGRIFTFPNVAAVILKMFSLVVPTAIIGFTIGIVSDLGTPRLFSKFNVQRISFAVWYIVITPALAIGFFLLPTGWLLHLVVIAGSVLFLRRFINASEAPDMDFRTEKL